MIADATTFPVGTALSTSVPGRLDRLLWSPWHWRVILALGITWVLDGLEASLIANLGGVLVRPDTLGLRVAQVGYANSAYLLGEIAGALLFGRWTDTYGRKKLFLVTLAVYLAGTALSGAASGFAMFALCRFVAGAGIGGEYAAINSAIDELIPARLRGRVDLGINGSYWVGVGLGGALTMLLLDPARLPVSLGWRLVFALGAAMGGGIVLVRRYLPESPRWLLMRGRLAEAEAVVAAIEEAVRRGAPSAVPAAPASEATVLVTGTVGFLYVARVLLRRHLRRSLLGLSLMVSQSFFYNAIFFSYALILGRYYGVPEGRAGIYVIPFAAGNFLGPLLLGRLFDTIGRRRMIATTYALSALLLLLSGYGFYLGLFDAATQTAAWCLVFFVASAAASSAYLTVSELFPVEIRGMAIALFFVVSQAAGAVATATFGRIIQGESRAALFLGYAVGAAFMLGAALTAAVLGVDAEGRSLEELTATTAPDPDAITGAASV